ncbi:MAG TPA: hypothetical protein VFF69_09585 [Phycisphaerales bacterium]|nr:hypothetical protein [Phycisphaerales bacterium]
MGQLDLLRHAVGALEAAGVPYMLTGSYASSLQGQPRATHDIDLVVELDASRVVSLLGAFPDDRYYFSREAIAAAVHDRSMFNVLDTIEGDKIDFWLLTRDSFDQERFARRTAIPFEGRDLWVSTPEDTILMKLSWSAQSGGSERQVEDARHVYEVSRGTIDEAYLESWADRLGVLQDLDRIRDTGRR